MSRNAVIWASVLLFFSLCSGVNSEELWVRNKPFQGQVRGSGSEMMVEARTFLKSLNIKAEDRGDVFIIGGFPIPVEKSGTIRLIPLRDVVDAAGLSISKNRALDTVDVRLAKAGKGHSGTWNANSDSGDSSSSDGKTKGTKTKLEGPTFQVSVPAHLTVVSDPLYLKNGESENAKAAQLNDAMNTGIGSKTAFAVTPQGGPTLGLLAVNMILNMNPDLTPKEEKELLTVIGEGIIERGGRIKGPPKTVRIAGKQYYNFQYDANDERGQKTKSEVYVHFSKKHERAFLLLLTAPSRRFNRVAPQLRLVVKNLRIK